jgi:hypothetical protein
VRILRDFKSNEFGSADCKGVRGAFCGNAECKGLAKSRKARYRTDGED